MAPQLADAAVMDSETMQEAMGRPTPSFDPIPAFDNDPMPDDDRLTVARGIVTAMVIASPFWALIAFTVYMLA